MPGLYIQDGGATSSALGNILGGLASGLGPQAQAEAQFLRLRSEQADWNNRLLSSQVPLTEQAAAAAPGILQSTGADVQPPGGSSVASTAASLAVPPIDAGQAGRGSAGRGVVSSAGMTPYQKYVANEIAAGRMSPDALKTTINIGQSQTRGPGETDAAIATRATTPLGPGTVINTTGQPGSPTIGGGSEYGSNVEKTGGTSDPAEAKKDVEDGAAANANLGKAQLALALYDQFLAPQANPTGVLTDEALKKFSTVLGMNVTRLTPIADVKAQIRSMFAGMVVNMRDSQGQPMFKGGLDQIMSQFPDPEAEPARFRSALEALQTSLARQAKDGQAAFDYLRAPSPQAMVTLLQRKGENAAEEGRAYAAAGLKVRQGEEAPAAAPAAAPAETKPPAPAAPKSSKPANVQLVPDIATGNKLPSGSFFRTPDGQLHKVD